MGAIDGKDNARKASLKHCCKYSKVSCVLLVPICNRHQYWTADASKTCITQSKQLYLLISHGLASLQHPLLVAIC
jgi:hypothetical protein